MTFFSHHPPLGTFLPPRRKEGQILFDKSRGLGGVVVIDAPIGVHGRGSRLGHYFTVAATLDKSLTSHCL